MSSDAAKKYCALSLFVLQNAGVVLLMRYSKVHPIQSAVPYSSLVAVLMTEVVKLPLCAVLHAHERGGPCASLSAVAHDVRTNWCEWLKLSLPALLYTVQNNMLFIGLANLEAAIAQVTYQLKIFFTALFSVCLLGRRLHWHQWFALGLLALGVLCVQGLPAKLADRLITHGSGSAAAASAVATPPLDEAAARAAVVGVSAMLTASLCSSFAGVYFEMMLKGSSTSLWLRNIQLGLWSALVAGCGVYSQPDPLIATHGLLHGFGTSAWGVVGANAFGGLLVAVTIKYAGNILRGFAQAVALIVGALGSRVLFGFTFSRDFCIGVPLVALATLLYGGACDTCLLPAVQAAADEYSVRGASGPVAVAQTAPREQRQPLLGAGGQEVDEEADDGDETLPLSSSGAPSKTSQP